MLHGRDLHFTRIGARGARAEADPHTHGPSTVLFLHGITESRRYFARPLAPLADRHELIIPDLPGFGLSPKPRARYSMEFFRVAIREFVVHHGLHERPLHIVGHSLGSLIALEYAAEHPGHLARLVLLNLPRHFSSHEAHRFFWNGSPSYRKLIRDHSLRASFGQLRRTGLTMSLRYARRFPWTVLMDARKFTFLSLTSTLENCLLNYQLDPLLTRVPRVPTLLIHGERDQVAPVDHIRPLSETCPWMEILTIPHSGHHVLHTHTAEVVQAIRAFLA